MKRTDVQAKQIFHAAKEEAINLKIITTDQVITFQSDKEIKPSSLVEIERNVFQEAFNEMKTYLAEDFIKDHYGSETTLTKRILNALTDEQKQRDLKRMEDINNFLIEILPAVLKG